ncbi:MAG: glycoside hydrolase family 28 protein [Lachnospiraceae bacterium]
MEIKLLMRTARSAVIEIVDGGVYYTKEKYQIYLNGKACDEVATVVHSIFGLKPSTNYHLTLEKDGCVLGSVDFETKYEFVTLNVKDFGAVGDGINNDTNFIQAAILACPKDSRVLIPKGSYKITCLFLKSDLNLELAEGAELVAENDRTLFPIFPGLIESYDEQDEYNLGTWEGNPIKSFAGIITGVNVENVVLYGQGSIHGNAGFDNWWYNEKVMRIAFRPRLIFLNHCKNVQVQGLLVHDSPSWTIHPYFSDDLGFYNIRIRNPKNAPNTDGIDPESCKNVEIAGFDFSLGDDCIAVKSGKIYMGRKYKKPSENIYIHQCLMQDGHGAVTIGSEMAGGVKNLVVENCIFSHTDRGLRIKTRRGRGKDAIIDQVIFRHLEMDHVMTPFVVNSYYFCDPDGRSDFVQDRAPKPVDDGTPNIKTLVFEDIHATNCHVAATYFEGLTEKKIEEIDMKNVNISFAEDAKTDVPAMARGVDACSKRGIFAKNVKKLVLDHVMVAGQIGPDLILEEIDELVK